MLNILVVSQDYDASETWFDELSQMRAEVASDDEPWEIVIQGDLPDRIASDCDLVFIDGYCGQNPSHPRAQALLDMCLQLRGLTTKVILLHSPVRSDDFAVKAYLHGVDEYIIKPISPSILLAKLQAWQQWTSKLFLLS